MPIPRVALMLALAGCAGSSRTPSAPPTIDTLPGGAVRVINHGPAEWTDTTGWRLELTRVIASADSGPAMLSSPRSIVAAPGGEIVVLDRRPAVLRVFAADGRFLRTIGREGSGPGEFFDFGNLAIVGDSLVVNDRQNSRLVVFTLDGTYLRTIAAEPTAMWGVTTIDGEILLDTYLERRPPSETEMYPGSGVRRLRTDGTVNGSYFYPPHPPARVWRLRNANADLGAFIPFTPDREKTVDRHGRLIYGDQGAYRFIVSTDGRDTVRIIEATAVPVLISDSARRAALAEVIEYSPWAEEIARLDEIPTAAPAWLDLRADDQDNLWVMRPIEGIGAMAFDVFDAEGVLRGTVAAPFDSFDWSWWGNDRIYRIGEDESGAARIEVWEVVKP